MQETSCTGSRAWKNKTRAWLLWSSNSPAILNVGFSIWFKDYREQSTGHNRDHEDAADPANEEHPTQNVRENRNHRLKHSARPPTDCRHYPTKNKRVCPTLLPLAKGREFWSLYSIDRKPCANGNKVKGGKGRPSSDNAALSMRMRPAAVYAACL